MRFSHAACLSRPFTFGAALAGLLVFGGVAASPAAAQALTYQLDNVTFSDGAAATGFFDFNPATGLYGPYSITTTNGVGDGLVGATYQPGPGAILQQDSTTGSTPYSFFGFSSNSTQGNFIAFFTNGLAISPNTYKLLPGTIANSNGFKGSGELAPAARAISSGSLIVTLAAVPETSTTVSFGLLLLLGMGGMMIAARRRTGAGG